MPTEVRYVCTGGCGGVVSEAEYNSGKTTCGTQGCPRFGQPFEKRYFCAQGKHYVEEGHMHAPVAHGGGMMGLLSKFFGNKK